MGLSLYSVWDDWPMWGFVILVIIVLGLFGYLVVDAVSAETQVERALVLEKFHEGRRTNVGVAVSSNGSAPVVTTSGPEYYLLLEFTDKRRALVKTNKYSLVQSDSGQEYKFYCRYGGLSENLLNCTR